MSHSNTITRVIWFRRYRIYIWSFIVFLGGEWLAPFLGIRFADNTLDTLYQYLDPEILKHDLARGLYYLHAQPPLFNLFLGGVFKLFANHSSLVFSFTFGAIGLCLLVLTTWLLKEVGVADGWNAVCCALLGWSPNFLVYRNWLFYTLPVALLVVLGAVCVVLFVGKRRQKFAWVFALVATALVFTRATFHPIWVCLFAVAVYPLVQREHRRHWLVAAMIPVVLAGAWSFKNHLVVGNFGMSSWLGMSAAKRWPLSQGEIRRLKQAASLPAFWHRRPFQEPRDFQPFGLFLESRNEHPALDAPYKSNGEPNFNHRDYAQISRAMWAGDIDLVLHYPGHYARRVATAVLLFLQPGPNSVHFLVDYDFSRVHWIRRNITRYLFLGGEIQRPIRMLEPPPNLLLLFFPALLCIGFCRARSNSLSRSSRALFVYAFVTVLWVTGVSNLIEIGENDRMRWEVEPLLIILFGTLLMSFGKRLAFLRRGHRQ